MVSNLERILMERGAKLPKSTKQAHRERQEAREILAITEASTNRANIIGRSRPNIMRGCLRIVKSAVFANRILHLEFFFFRKISIKCIQKNIFTQFSNLSCWQCHSEEVKLNNKSQF